MADINFPSAPSIDDTHTDANGVVWTYDGKRWLQIPYVIGAPVLADGTQALTADWDAGSFDITALQFHSDIVTGTSPLTVASTTVVSNLNADQVDGLDSTDLGRLATASEWTKTQNFNATTLTDGATINWDASSNQVTKVTLGGNRTMANPTNMVDGGFYSLLLLQDGTGGRTVTWGSNYQFTDGLPPVLTTTANVADIIIFQSNGTKMKEIGRSLNIS